MTLGRFAEGGDNAQLDQCPLWVISRHFTSDRSTDGFRPIAAMRFFVVGGALLPENHILKHIMNHLCRNLDEKHLSGQFDALKSVRRWWKNIN